MGQPAPGHHDVDTISCLQVHDEVERPWTPTSVQSPLGPVVFQELSLVAGRVQLGHAGIGDRQDSFHVRVPLRSEGGCDQVAPIIRSREDAWEGEGRHSCHGTPSQHLRDRFARLTILFVPETNWESWSPDPQRGGSPFLYLYLPYTHPAAHPLSRHCCLRQTQSSR